jgi:hypothetical protein
VKVFLSVQLRPAQPQLQLLDQLQDFAGRARFQDIGDQRGGEGLNEAGDIRWIRHDFLVQKGRQFARRRAGSSLEPGALFTCSKGVAGGHLPCTVISEQYCSPADTFFAGFARNPVAKVAEPPRVAEEKRKSADPCEGFFRAASFRFGKLDLIARMFELGHSRHRYPISASGCRRASYTSWPALSSVQPVIFKLPSGCRSRV